MARKGAARKGRKKQGLGGEYVVQIRDWDVNYSLYADLEKRFSDGPYWEHTELTIVGTFVKPAKLAGRGVKMAILGSRQQQVALNKPEEATWTVKGVGAFTVNKRTSEYIGSVPFDVVGPIVSLLGQGKLGFVSLSGEDLYRGSARMRSISFEKEYYEELEE